MSYDYIEEHLTECKIALVKCPNECEDETEKTVCVKRTDLSHHLKEECPYRKYECKLCKRTGIYQDLGPTHEQNCPKRKVDCPNTGCGKTMEYRLLNVHVTKECEYTVIPCEVCGTKFERKSLAEHKQSDMHHAIHDKTAKNIAKTSSDAAKTSSNVSKMSRDAAKMSESVEKLKKEVKSLRRWLIAAVVICLLLLAAVTIVTTEISMKASNETEVVKELVLSMHMDISEFLESHTQSDDMGTETLDNRTTTTPKEKVVKKAADLKKKLAGKIPKPKAKVAASKEKGAAANATVPARELTPEEKVTALEEKVAALQEKLGIPEEDKDQALAEQEESWTTGLLSWICLITLLYMLYMCTKRA